VAVTVADVLSIVACIEKAGIRIWLDGGWGVDALVGRETRRHGDLDAVIELNESDAILTVLAQLRFRLVLDDRPTRFVLADELGRRIDFHPLVFDREGNGMQIGAGAGGGDATYPAEGLTGVGAINGHRVACLKPELLLRHHTGYEPQDKDRHNVRLLCDEFGLPIPRAYRDG
jgi:lincosamide nucleotidyltransferase A/C/D/E